jgi:alkylation response protein AidB-like acyl-CoA dehydrogenase
LSQVQREARRSFRAFVDEHIAPYAAKWDSDQRIPLDIVRQLRRQGYLGALHPCHPGGAIDSVTYGLLTEEIGRACSSVRSLLTVHDMVALGLWRWGNNHIKSEFGNAVAQGLKLCSLALSEPDVGSDAAAVSTEAFPDGDEYVLTGRKKWITFGQIADLFLVLARCQGRLAAFLVPAKTPGLVRFAMTGIVGTRASLLAELSLDQCRLPGRYLIGPLGAGLSLVFSSILDAGRYSVAWGSVGIAQACLDASLLYASQRKQFGVALREHQLVQRELTQMIANTRAARLLCYRAGYLRQMEDPAALAETMLAKYFASQVAVSAANAAVHLHGANGLTDEYNVARHLRDAKVMEVIEGSTEIQQQTIPGMLFAEL